MSEAFQTQALRGAGPELSRESRGAERRGADAGAGWEAEQDGLRLDVHERGTGSGDTSSLPCFTVDDMAAALDRVRELGGSIVHPGERWAVCRESEGSHFALAASSLRR